MSGFKKAKPQQAALKMGIFGPAGSGKTFTSLLIAEGLAKASGKKIAYVDTEHGTDFYAMAVPERRIHPEAFEFEALYTRSLTAAKTAIEQLDPEEFGVIVIDSMTHFWEACQAAYTGKRTSDGRIPIHAWGKLKKPYKDLEAYMLKSKFHTIVCGRQGVVFGKDEETGDLEAQGFRMKAEGETPYEPHILLRMFTKQTGVAQVTYVAYAEKDRSGVLAGRFIEMPCFDNIAKPVMSLLGIEQAQLQSSDEAESIDRAALEEEDRSKVETSARLTRQLVARYELCETWPAFDEVNDSVTPETKAQLTQNDQADLREVAIKKFDELTRALGPKPKAPQNKDEWIQACANHAMSLGLENHEAIATWAATKNCIEGMAPADLLGTKTLSMMKVVQLKQLHAALLEELKG